MKGLLAVLWCTLLIAAPVAMAQDKSKAKAPTEAQKKQQERMSACNKEANEKKLKGDERKKFVNGCLKGSGSSQAKAPSAKQKAQQDKMGDCNKQANLKNMKGEERKNFMSSCLKG
jgi:mannitol-specific phosphotransferase system IIBC component